MILRETPQLRDGKWLMVPIHGEAEAEDVEKILLKKILPVKKQNQ